ncbi:MAG: restriction endonuclease, partial [Methanoregula sp.]
PFLEIDLSNLDEQLIEQLKKYAKHSLDLDNLYDDASRLKYTKEIMQVADKEFSNPSGEFVRFFAQKVYKKKLTQKAIDQFTSITKDSLDQFLSDKINERLKSAMQPKPAVAPNEDVLSVTPTQEISPKNDGIVTTEDEWEGYYFVKAMLHDIVDPSKIVMRDAKSYCAILFDDNNRKPLCRLYFDGKQKYVALFDNNDRQETKVPIENIADLFKLKDRIRSVANSYLSAQ